MSQLHVEPTDQNQAEANTRSYNGDGSAYYGNLWGMGYSTSPVNQQQINSTYGQTNDALNRQNAFTQALQYQNGVGNQSSVFNQQQQLANQLQQQAMGQGPNPAQAQLAQNTGNNMAQQAALMGSARGAGANPGLVARQAAMQGGAQQQNAVGQAATLQANQQLAAEQALQNQQNMMGNLSSTQVGQLGQANQLGAQNALANQGQVLGAAGAQNTANVQAQASANAANAQLEAINRQGLWKMGGGLFGGIGAALSLAHGGIVDGSQSSSLLQYHCNMADGGIATESDLQNQGNNALENIPLTRDPSDKGGSLFGSKGGKVPGKAKVSADSEKNDTVPAMLSPGEVVIPKSKMRDEHKIASFLNSLLGTQLRAS